MSGPLPELLVGRRDRRGSRRWSVSSGPARRGEAWTDVGGCEMRVPFLGGGHGRLVRAHELMHARVSPVSPHGFEAFEGVSARSVECAEEFRVNELLVRVGFDLEELRDGSERLAGERLAAAGEWDELVRFAAALSGTRALSELVRGVRRARPAWAAPCRALERELRAAVRRVPTAELASTTPTASGLPAGFADHTRALGALIDGFARAGGASGRRRVARPSPTGAFAPLVLDATVALDLVVRGGRVPFRAKAASGRRARWPERVATDPARRVFERRTVRRGGVVVVDQSGSMALDPGELAALLAAAPGAFVLGYSHAPGSVGVPNAWVLADRGRAASQLPGGNVGNGVDGPALRHALGRRRGTEPVVWVCDGQVTDAADHADGALAAECARLALRHGVAMVATVPEAIAALAGVSRARKGRLLGRVAAAAGAVTARP